MCLQHSMGLLALKTRVTRRKAWACTDSQVSTTAMMRRSSIRTEIDTRMAHLLSQHGFLTRHRRRSRAVRQANPLSRQVEEPLEDQLCQDININTNLFLPALSLLLSHKCLTILSILLVPNLNPSQISIDRNLPSLHRHRRPISHIIPHSIRLLHNRHCDSNQFLPTTPMCLRTTLRPCRRCPIHLLTGRPSILSNMEPLQYLPVLLTSRLRPTRHMPPPLRRLCHPASHCTIRQPSPPPRTPRMVAITATMTTGCQHQLKLHIQIILPMLNRSHPNRRITKTLPRSLTEQNNPRDLRFRGTLILHCPRAFPPAADCNDIPH